MASAQDPTDAVEGVAGPAAVPEGVLLHAASDLVNRVEAQLDHMERIQDADRAGQLGAQRARVPPEGVQRRDRHPRPPAGAAGAQPARQDSATATRHDVEQPGRTVGAGEVDQPGRELGGVGRARGQKGGLVHPERGHAGQPGRVVDQWSAVLADRPHHRAPPDAEIGGHRGHRLAELANAPAGHRGCPRRQRRPRRYRRAGLRPRAHLAALVATAPQPLEPNQRRRATAYRQITHPHRPASVRGCDRTAAGTADHVVAGLHGQLELAVVLVNRDQPEPVETEDHRPEIPRARSICAHLGPSLRSVQAPRRVRPQAHDQAQAEDRVLVTSPRSMTKSPLSGLLGPERLPVAAALPLGASSEGIPYRVRHR
jgi:hypothetical protein